MIKAGAIVLSAVAVLLVFGTGTATAGTLLKYDVSEKNSSVGGDAFSDPGLEIEYAFVADLEKVAFGLEDGQSKTFDFFHIWTDETSVNWDDLKGQDIEAVLAFDLPPDTKVVVDGETTAKIALFGIFQWGTVEWDGKVKVVTDDRIFTVELSDEKFNSGVFGLSEGKRYGATVQATVTQISAVPLPAAGWMGLLLLSGAGVVRRLRRR